MLIAISHALIGLLQSLAPGAGLAYLASTAGEARSARRAAARETATAPSASPSRRYLGQSAGSPLVAPPPVHRTAARALTSPAEGADREDLADRRRKLHDEYWNALDS